MNKIIVGLFLSMVINGCVTKNINTANEYTESGIALYEQQRYEEAIVYFTKSIELNSSDKQALNNRGVAYLQTGKIDEAITDFSRSIVADENNSFAYYNRGISWEIKENYDRALNDYNKALTYATDKDRAQIYNNRGIVWFKKDEYARAVDDFSSAMKEDKMYADPYFNRGEVFRETFYYQNAMSDFIKAYEIDSKHQGALNSIAWLLATCPNEEIRNGEKAVIIGKEAVQISGSPHAYDTLAAAYAESGMFNDAVATQKIAIEKLKATDDRSLIDEHLHNYTTRIELYRSKKPWRDK